MGEQYVSIAFEGENRCRHERNEAMDVGVRKARFILPNETIESRGYIHFYLMFNVFTTAQTIISAKREGKKKRERDLLSRHNKSQLHFT